MFSAEEDICVTEEQQHFQKGLIELPGEETLVLRHGRTLSISDPNLKYVIKFLC